jgi:hypothetical protein
VTFVADLTAAAAAAMQAAGSSAYVNVLGADVGQQCLQTGLLDEIWSSSHRYCWAAGRRCSPRRVVAASTSNRRPTAPLTGIACVADRCAPDTPPTESPASVMMRDSDAASASAHGCPAVHTNLRLHQPASP